MIKAKLKTLKLLSFSLAIILSACNLPGGSALPQSPSGAVAAMTLQVNPTQTQMVIALTSAPIMIDLPKPTPLPPDTPVWSAYNYTCELVDGGGDMTMYLTWFDRSDSEEGYKVYRDQKLIATLEPNSMFYADMTFVADGKTVSYSIEAFNKDWQASTTTIAYGCQ